jgi:hypothetical protein
VNTAPTIDVLQTAMAPPSPQGGGAPPDGTYFVTSDVIYSSVGGTSGPTGVTLQETLSFSGTTVNEVSTQLTNGVGCTSTLSGTLNVSTTTLTLTPSCPTDCKDCSDPVGYTTTTNPNALQVFIPVQPGVTEVETYTQQ